MGLLQGVANGSLSVGDTVLFITILQQLYVPLNYFGAPPEHMCSQVAALLCLASVCPRPCRHLL